MDCTAAQNTNIACSTAHWQHSRVNLFSCHAAPARHTFPLTQALRTASGCSSVPGHCKTAPWPTALPVLQSAFGMSLIRVACQHPQGLQILPPGGAAAHAQVVACCLHHRLAAQRVRLEAAFRAPMRDVVPIDTAIQTIACLSFGRQQTDTNKLLLQRGLGSPGWQSITRQQSYLGGRLPCRWRPRGAPGGRPRLSKTRCQGALQHILGPSQMRTRL